MNPPGGIEVGFIHKNELHPDVERCFMELILNVVRGKTVQVISSASGDLFEGMRPTSWDFIKPT